jgi:hypothetical protein
MLTGSAPKRHSACLASAVERCFRLLPRDLRWSALSTLLEAQMITGRTAVSLMARGGTTDCAVSPVHNVFDAPPPHARLPGNLVGSGSKCEKLNVSKSSPLCLTERTSIRRAASSLMGANSEVALSRRQLLKQRFSLLLDQAYRSLR